MSRENEQFDLYRKYAEHEDDLINQRANWIYLIQSFLVATYGFTIQKKLEVLERLKETKRADWPRNLVDTIDQVDLFLNIISITGIAIGVVGTLSILAAFLTIRLLERQWGTYRASKGGPNFEHIPGLTGGGSPRYRRLGMSAGLIFPVLLILMWIALLRLSVEFKVSLQGAGSI